MNGQFDIGEITPKRYFTITAIIIGLLFGLAESQTSSFTGFLKGIIQWQLQVAIPMVFLIIIHIGLNKLKIFTTLNPWLKLLISGFCAAVAFVPLSLAIDVFLIEEPLASNNLLKELFIELAHMAPPVIITWIVINAPWLMGYKLVKSTTQITEPDESLIEAIPSDVNIKNTHPKFFELLPKSIQSEIIFLKAELHYLQVTTTTGKALILYNLKDAINELNVSEGIQTHRSYWVARKFMQKLKKNGRQGTVILENGNEIAVSRTNFEKVKKLLDH